MLHSLAKALDKVSWVKDRRDRGEAEEYCFYFISFCSKQERLSADDLSRASSAKPMKDLLPLPFAV